MGLLDKLKGLTKGHKQDLDKGIDKVADVVENKTPDQHDGKVESAADAAKDYVEKLPD